MRSISLALLLLAAGVLADNNGGHGSDKGPGGGDHGGGADNQGSSGDQGSGSDGGDGGDMGGQGGGNDMGGGDQGGNGQGAPPRAPTPVPATWDGSCYYARPDVAFDLSTYAGRWYQVAGTEFPYTAGSKCVSAFYTLNEDGTLGVNNTSEAPDGAYNEAIGTASAVPALYGATGAYTVEFDGVPGARGNPCPGPNYVVQDYTGDWAVVQSMNFSTLFLLSRNQHPGDEAVDAWIKRAGQLGSDLTKVTKTNQDNCKYLS